MVTDYNSALPVRNGDNVGIDNELAIKTLPGTEIEIKSATGSSGVAVFERNETGVKVDITTDSTPSGVKVNIIADNANLAKEDGGNLEDIKTAVEIIDDWDENDRAKVNVNWNTGQPVTLNQGNSDSGTLRVTIANDDINLSAIKTAVEIIDNWDNGTNQAAVSIENISEIVGQKTASDSIPVVVASDQVLNVNIVEETAINPVHVYWEEVVDDGGDEHTWTYTNSSGKTLMVEQVFSAASGKFRVIVKVTDNTIALDYATSANPKSNLIFTEPIAVANGDNIKILLKNMDKDAMTIGAYINGYLK